MKGEGILPNWCLEVWGDYACFTRPEMKVERVSYELITPSAARAIFEAVFWKPAIRWNITKIEVLNPIKWISFRRNEVGKISYAPTQKQMSGSPGDPLGMYIEHERQLRAGLLLKDVRYRIHGYFDYLDIEDRPTTRATAPGLWADQKESQLAVKMDESEAKYAAMFERRARKGQCFHRPYLGCREFACSFKLVDPFTHPIVPIKETRELGFMLYDMDFSKDKTNPTPLFFKARIENGVLYTDRKIIEVKG